MKAWTIIQNDRQYKLVMERVEKLSANPPSVKSDEGKELLLLGYLADKYESEMFPIVNPDPIDAIKVRMNELGIGIADLKDAFGDKGTASKVLSRKRSLSINMVRALSKRLSLPESLLLNPIKKSNSIQSKRQSVR